MNALGYPLLQVVIFPSVLVLAGCSSHGEIVGAPESGASKQALEDKDAPTTAVAVTTGLEPMPEPIEVEEPSARTTCSTHADCHASCAHGAVSLAWHEQHYPGGESCQDGCTSKGSESPQCVDGGCVAFRDGARDEGCTNLDNPPIEGVGWAHACNTSADCTRSCSWGSVSKRWYEATERGPECKDGCTSKGMSSGCVDGVCTTYDYDKKVVAWCTQKVVPR